jgi:hypothetical protein
MFPRPGADKTLVPKVTFVTKVAILVVLSATTNSPRRSHDDLRVTTYFQWEADRLTGFVLPPGRTHADPSTSGWSKPGTLK